MTCTAGRIKQLNKIKINLESLSPSVCVKVRVPQLQVDGRGERGLSCAAQSVHPPGLPGLR